MAEGFFKSTHPGAQLATIIPLGLCLGDVWLKKSGAGREAAGDVLQSRTTCICGATSFALLLFCRLAFPFSGVVAAAPVPLFHSERDRRDGGSWAAKQENMRCMPRDCVLLWVEDWDEGARGERERANRWEREDCGSAVVRLTLWKGVVLG